MNNDATSPPHDSTSTVEGAIIVGYDGSESSLAAVRRGVSLAFKLHRNLRVIQAWHMPVSYSGYVFNSWSPEEDTRQMLADLVTTVFPDGAPAWFSADCIEGETAHILIRESEGAEMLVLGSRGHGGFVGLLLGSVSSACAEHAKCSVLIMRTPAAPDTASATLIGAASH